MALIQCMTTSFCKELLQGGHNFGLLGNTFKIALYAETAVLGPQTTAYTTTGEISATGYTAGGATLVNLGTSSAGTTGYTSFSDVTWTGGVYAAGALIYNSTNANASVCVLSFGMTRYSVGTTFAISFPTNNSTSAIIRVNAPLA